MNLPILILLGGIIGLIIWKRCDILPKLCDVTPTAATPAPVIPSPVTKDATHPGPHTDYSVTAGPQSIDLGYGFSKAGDPIGSNGKSYKGEPKATDPLPPTGPCQTKLYKGLIQYRGHGGLSASSDTCEHAKRDYAYKFGPRPKTSNYTRISI